MPDQCPQYFESKRENLKKIWSAENPVFSIKEIFQHLVQIQTESNRASMDTTTNCLDCDEAGKRL